MKKLLLILTGLWSFAVNTNAQWNVNGSHVYYADGNVGIGLTAPTTRLQVFDGPVGGAPTGTVPGQGILISGSNTGGALNFGIDGTGNFYSWIQSRNRANANVYTLALNPMGGKVGIGTTTPESNVHVKASGTNTVTLESTGTGTRYCHIRFKDNGNILGYVWTVPETNVMSIGKGGHQHINMRLDNDFVGIGTTAPDAKLTVNGDIHAREVRVDLNGSVAPDYVFGEEYELMSLDELEVYVTNAKHLPEIPSAEEMEHSGIMLKEMNLLLLKKLEEVTLHLIEMNKKVRTLEEQNCMLQDQMSRLTGGMPLQSSE